MAWLSSKAQSWAPEVWSFFCVSLRKSIGIRENLKPIGHDDIWSIILVAESIYWISDCLHRFFVVLSQTMEKDHSSQSIPKVLAIGKQHSDWKHLNKTMSGTTFVYLSLRLVKIPLLLRRKGKWHGLSNAIFGDNDCWSFVTLLLLSAIRSDVKTNNWNPRSFDPDDNIPVWVYLR